jgi:hypothetical protein
MANVEVGVLLLKEVMNSSVSGGGLAGWGEDDQRQPEGGVCSLSSELHGDGDGFGVASTVRFIRELTVLAATLLSKNETEALMW